MGVTLAAAGVAVTAVQVAQTAVGVAAPAAVGVTVTAEFAAETAASGYEVSRQNGALPEKAARKSGRDVVERAGRREGCWGCGNGRTPSEMGKEARLKRDTDTRTWLLSGK